MHRQTAKVTEKNISLWLSQRATPDILLQIEELPLRRDMMTLLTYVRNNKVIGTQSTGNMPLKVVREVTAHFVTPPVLEETIGDHTYQLRSEADLWPLYFLHILAEVGELLIIAPARRWWLTPHGEDFMNTPPAMQLSFLLNVWWYKVNWLIAYPYVGMGDALPASFNRATLAHLRMCPVGATITFKKFADDLIAKTRLRWTSVDATYHAMFLRGAVSQMIIYILKAFGVLTIEYHDEPLGRGSISELDAFKITPLGDVLLDNLYMNR